MIHRLAIKDGRVVEFEGTEIGSRGSDWYSETLYKLSDGRLVVSRGGIEYFWTYIIKHVTDKDLLPGGIFSRLGARCGFKPVLTIEEAIDDGQVDV